MAIFPTSLTQVELTSAIVCNPLVVTPHTTVMDAITQMSGVRALCSTSRIAASHLDDVYIEARSSCVIVVENSKLVGIFTERDVVRLSAEKRPLENLLIREVMTRSVVVLRESAFTDLLGAVNLLQQHHIRHLPVLDEHDRLIGLLTHESLRQISRPVDLLRLRLVTEVMATQVVCASPDVAMLAIAQLMTQHRVSSVVIVQELDNQQAALIPIGIVTERDVVQFQALNLDLETCLVRSVMSTPIFSVRPQDSLWAVQRLMEQRLIRRVAVTGAQGELLGIVTQSSLLQILNPMELYKLANVLEQKVSRLEAEKIEILERRAIELEQQVEERTAVLKAKAAQASLVTAVATQIRASLNLQDVLNTTVEKLRAILSCDRVLVYQFQPDWSGMIIAESVEHDSLSLLSNRIYDSCLQVQTSALYTSDHPIVVNNIYASGYTGCHLQFLERHQVKANLVVPIRVTGQLWGLLIGHQCIGPRDWQQDDVTLLRDIAVQLAIAIQQATVYQQAQTELAERRQTEARLRESEAHQRALIRAIPDLIMRVNQAGIYMEFVASPNFHVVGNIADLVGTHVRESLPPGLAQKRIELIQQALQTDAIQIYEQDLSIEGRTQVEEARVVPYSKDEVLILVRDISDRKQAERQVQNLIEGTAAATGQDFFPALVRHTAEALNVSHVLVTERIADSLHTLAFWANGTLQPTFAYQLEDTPCGQAVREGLFYCECQVQQIFPENLDLVEMGVESYLGIALHNTEGQAIGNLCILDRQPLQNPQRVEQILRVFAARTAAELERQRASASLEQLNQELEAKVEARTAELRERKQFLQTVMDTFPLSVFWKDRDLTFLGCNRNFLQDAGLESVADLIGKTDYDMPWSPIEARAYRIADKQVMDSDTARLGVVETQRQANGKQIWIETNKLPLHDLMGDVIGVLGTYQDITDRKQAEQENRQQAERETLLREISQRIRQSLDLQTIFDTACQEIRSVLQSDRVGIFKFCSASNYDDGEFVAESVIAGVSSVVAMRIHDDCFGEQYSTLYGRGKFYVIDDIYQNGSTTCHTDILAQLQVRANLVMPLLCGERLWGLLCVHQCTSTRHWEQFEIDLTQQLANQLAIAIQQASLYDQIQSELLVRQQAEAKIALQLRRQEALGAIVQQIRESLDLNEILATVTQQVKDVLHGDRVIVFRLFADGRSQIVEEAVSSKFPTLKNRQWADEVWSPDILDCYCQGKPRIVPDVMNDPWTNCLVDYSIEGQIQSKMIAPILQDVRGGETHRWVAPGETSQLWGILIIHACREQRVWQESEAQLLQQIANQLAIAIQQAHLFEQLQQELTERQQAQLLLTERNQQLAISNQELARATRLKDEFLANMSHELRTPLNAILGLTEGLQEQIFGSINPEQCKVLQTIERSSSHLLELINDILDVAKIESGQMELEYTPTTVASLCQSSLTFIKQQALKKRIQLDIQLPAHLPELLIDQRRIRQVLINLLNNAVKFTPDGGRITLAASYQQRSTAPNSTAASLQHYLRIAVTDTGIGIAPEHIDKLFKPFVQVDSALNRQYAGTGLGLALVKQIVELHGGQVSLTSQLESGSCFMIDLPCTAFVPISPERVPPSDSTLELSQSTQSVSPLILLAEDNEANISTVTSYLKAKGYRTLVARNGQEAIALARVTSPDVILMDIQMPGMDGLEAMQRIRSDPDLKAIPMIALTALAMETDRERCLAAGATKYLSKPIKLKQLIVAIQTLLTPESN